MLVQAVIPLQYHFSEEKASAHQIPLIFDPINKPTRYRINYSNPEVILMIIQILFNLIYLTNLKK